MLLRMLRRPIVVCLLSLALPCSSFVFGQFEADARWAPADTNVLVMIHSHRLFDSPYAKKERAQEASRASFEAGTSLLTPDVDRIMVTSQFDFEVMYTLWSGAVLSGGNRKFDMGEIANRTGAALESLAGRKAVLLPNDAYLVQLSPESVGVMRPGNRQSVTRWLKSATASGSNQLSKYLKEAVSYADKNLDVIIAMDLSDTLDKNQIESRLKEMESISKEEVPALTDILEGIEGLTLGITMKESINGSIKVDVARGGKGLEKSGKNLLIEVLQRRGVMLDDITNWSVKVDDRHLILSGPLSMAGIRAIDSLVSQPLVRDELLESEAEAAATAPYARSKTYMQSLDNYYQQLSSKKLDYRTIKSYAGWFDLYAQKIEDFSVLGVDEELVQVGTETAASLRKISNLLNETSAAIRVQKSEVKANYGYGYYGWDYRYGNGNKYRDYQLKAIESRGEAFADKETREIMAKINTDIVRVKQSLSTKYGVKF